MNGHSNTAAQGQEGATYPTSVMVGMLTGNCLFGPKDAAGERGRLRFLVLFGLGLHLAGILLRPLRGINKPDRTEAYALVTGGISCALFALVYSIVDIKRWPRWNAFLAPPGQNALRACILPGMVANAFAIFGLSVYWSRAGLSSVASAVVLTLVLLALIWFLTKARVVMKL